MSPQIEPYTTTPFFINTRNFKKRWSNQVGLSGMSGLRKNLIVPIPDSSQIVDDYNPNYSVVNNKSLIT